MDRWVDGADVVGSVRWWVLLAVARRVAMRVTGGSSFGKGHPRRWCRDIWVVWKVGFRHPRRCIRMSNGVGEYLCQLFERLLLLVA